MALAPPPGTTLRSQCLRISTGASRETREISPKTNSSATRSARTVTVSLGKDSTIFRRRRRPWFSLCFVIDPALRGATKIFSRAGLPFRDSCQNGIDNGSRIVEGELELGDGEGIEFSLQRAQIHSVFFRCQEAG